MAEKVPFYDIHKVCQPIWDPVFSVDHQRLLKDLVETEHIYQPDRDYFSKKQTDIQPWMRRMVSSWMKEVCEEQNAELDVYTLSMQLFDRFLTLQEHQREHLQLLGAACTLLASKLKEAIPFTVEKLAMFTDYSVTREQMLNMELTVSRVLDFDFCGSTPFDFLLPLLNYLRSKKLLTESFATKIRQECRTLVCQYVAEECFLHYASSVLTASCILVVGVHTLRFDPLHISCIMEELTSILLVNATHLRSCYVLVEKFFLSTCAATEVSLNESLKMETCCITGEEVAPRELVVDSMNLCGPPQPDLQTPSDIRDVCF